MTNPPRIVPILEALATTVEVMPWGVAALPSIGAVIVWDSRDDSSFAIIDAVVGRDGESVETHSIAIGRNKSIIGAMVILKTNRYAYIESFVGVLRSRYAIATGPDPNKTDRPF